MNQFTFLIIFLAVPSGIFSSKIAGSKGWDRVNWFFLGLIFNLIGLFVASSLYDKKQRKYLRLIAESQGISSNDLDRIEENDYLYNKSYLKHIGEFILPKNSSKLDILEKIIEVMGSDFSPNVDRNKIIIRKQPFSNYRKLILRNLKGSIILVAHGRDHSLLEYKWFLENPPSVPLPDLLLILKSRLTQFRRSSDF
tara:strand:- start:255 stop:842 length:588 start_codon:yes stop_codon:yes gene_type:complete